MNSIRFQHKQYKGTDEQIQAMRWVKNNINEQDFDGKAFAMSQTYGRWEIDEVIGWELQRNLLLSLGCVAVATLVLIADFRSCLLVIICVLLNIVRVKKAHSQQLQQ
jgi:hypothetical protein